MSRKMECPSCNAYTSSVIAAFKGGAPCPHCGLSNAATTEILAIRHREANEDLTRRLESAIVRADRAEEDVRTLRATLNRIEAALARSGRLDDERRGIQSPSAMVD